MTFVDNTPMDPDRDLSYYELYVRVDANFTDTDLPVAEVAAVSQASSPDGQSVAQSQVTEFNLNLLPSVPEGQRLYVSLRAVGIDTQKSAFMTPVVWDRM